MRRFGTAARTAVDTLGRSSMRDGGCAHLVRACPQTGQHERLCALVRGRTRIHTHTYPRRIVRDLSAGVDCAVRLAGVLWAVHVQREHRCMEHCTCLRLVLGVRRFGPATRHVPDALGRASMLRGPLCAAALPMHANVCAHTRTGTRLRGHPRVYV